MLHAKRSEIPTKNTPATYKKVVAKTYDEKDVKSKGGNQGMLVITLKF